MPLDSGGIPPLGLLARGISGRVLEPGFNNHGTGTRIRLVILFFDGETFSVKLEPRHHKLCLLVPFIDAFRSIMDLASRLQKPAKIQ